MIDNRKARLKETENVVTRSYVKILGRYPDDGGKKGYVNSIIAGDINILGMEHRLMGCGEFRDRLSRYCKMHGRDVTTLPMGFISPRLPGDPVLDGYDQLVDTGAIGKFSQSIVLVSTWDIKCGIATYTSYLIRELKKLGIEVDVFPVNTGITGAKIPGKLLELEHEFGIMNTMVNTDSDCIVCWHTVPTHIADSIKMFEKSGNIVGHIVHSEEAANFIRSNTNSKDIYFINHGSKLMPEIKKEDARTLLDLEDLYEIRPGDKFAFVFGFQASSKNFNEIIEATRKAGIKLVISGARHQCGYESDITVKENTIFLGRWLTDIEIDLWAMASDLLVFSYVKQSHYSCSGAMHRIIGSGRPVICSRTLHFTDIKEEADCLKFEGQEELRDKIKEGLEREEEFGAKALEYAKRTSWENVARQRVEIYKKFVMTL